MSRSEDRIARVKALDISALLMEYGYPIHGGNREEQFPCDLHGDGMDNKPSGRLYPETNTTYCFTCNKTRDTIELIREKEGLAFWAAVKHLEEKYSLPALPWSGDEGYQKDTTAAELSKSLNPQETFEDDLTRLTKFIKRETNDRQLPMADILTFWEARDRLVWMFSEKLMTERQARLAATALRQRLMDTITESRRK